MLDEKGYSKPSYEDILGTMEQKAKELFGEDIDVSELTPLGKFIGIVANIAFSIYEDQEALYYAAFPNTARGVSLDRLCVLAGISRNAATQAQHKIIVYGEAGATFGIGELVVCGEDSDITFYNVNEFTIEESGSVEVIVECAEAGTVGNVTDIDQIVNPLEEIEDIQYSLPEKLGEDCESDYDLRKRFSLAIAGAGSGNINAIVAALLRVPEVTSASIIVNEAEHSFECFVSCDAQETYAQQIAETIFEKAPIGIQTAGNETVTVIDAGGYPHEIKFSWTGTVEISIKISYTTDTTFETDGDAQIKTALTEYINGLGTGETVIYSSLFSKIFSVAGVTDVTNLEISKDGKTFVKENITVGQSQSAKVKSIEVT